MFPLLSDLRLWCLHMQICGCEHGCRAELRAMRRNRGTGEAGRAQKTQEEKQKGELGEIA